MAKQIVVLGGGISGLTFAWALRRALPTAHITVLEGTRRVGGWLQSHRTPEGFLFERGCRGVRGGAPTGDGAVVHDTFRLLEQEAESAASDAPPLQLMANHALASKRYIMHAGALEPMPASPLELLSWKPLPNPLWLAAKEPFQPTAEPRGADESVRDFVSRRLSPAVADNLVDAMIAGVWAGRSEEVSVHAALPALAELEAAGGSIAAGLLGRRLGLLPSPPSASGPYTPRLSPWFGAAAESLRADCERRCGEGGWLRASGRLGAASISTASGTQGITDALAASLDGDSAPAGRESLGTGSVTVRRGCVATALAPTASGGASLLVRPYVPRCGSAPEAEDEPLVSLSDAASPPAPAEQLQLLAADLVVSALPAPALGDALQAGIAGGWAGAGAARVAEAVVPALRGAPRASVGVVCAGWDTPAVRQGAQRRGFGFLAPAREDARLLGTVWDSCIFPGQALPGREASDDRASVMLGGRRDQSVAQMPLAELEDAGWASLVADTGVPAGAEPTAMDARVAQRAIPQYTVGHFERVQRLQDDLRASAPWLRLLGNSFYGVGAAACIANARAAAEQVAAEMSRA